MLKFQGQDILSTKQFTRDDIDALIEIAHSMEDILKTKKQSNLLQGKILATLFFEPSTRTRLSFECAMLRLGGQVVSMAEAAQTSSVTKGETLKDMGRIVGNYVDVIAMRHPETGSVESFAEGTKTPVLNAGDGSNEHPTQALIDMYTIQKEHGTFDGLTIGMCGDLRYGRTVHSLATLLFHYNVKLVFISSDDLKMPPAITQGLRGHKLEVVETDDFASVIDSLDVLYMTRFQRERFSDFQEYEHFARRFELTEDLMRKARKNLVVMHPLPRVSEIPPELDSDPRSKYFEQALNGVPVRMALLSLVIGAVQGS